MPHDHSHNFHPENGSDPAARNIATAFFLNLFFAAVELAGGLWTNSVAILSDALHDFGDSVSLGIAWGLQKRSKRTRDDKFSYGYKRFSLLGSVFLSGVLLVSSVFIIVESVRRLFDPQEVMAKGMFWLAIAGVVINSVAAIRLRKGKTHNERAVFIHMMEDVLGWLAVLAASVVMMFVDLPILDPLLSLCITGWVLWNVFRNLRGTFKILLQGIPEGIDTRKLTEEIVKIPGVESIHDLHVWSQDGITHVGTVHAVVSKGLPEERVQRIKEEIRRICRRYHTDHVTIETEPSGGCDCEYALDDR